MDDYNSDEIINELFRAYKEQCKYGPKNIDAYRDLFLEAKSYSNPNSLKVKEALIIMLQVVHLFKYLIDLYYENIDDSDSEYMNKEIEDIINHRPLNNRKRFFKITPGDLSVLLLQVLYRINGTYYKVNDTDYALEEELDKILELTNWSYELDYAITKSILLPLYFEAHSNPDEEDEEEDV